MCTQTVPADLAAATLVIDPAIIVCADRKYHPTETDLSEVRNSTWPK